MSKPRLLIVDDDRDFAASIALRSRALGLDVETAGNLLTAMTIIGLRPPDVICLDVWLPTGNGLTVCECLANDSTLCRRPIIVLTGCRDARTIQRCQELGAHYVYKSSDVWRRLRPLLANVTCIGRDQSFVGASH